MGSHAEEGAGRGDGLSVALQANSLEVFASAVSSGVAGFKHIHGRLFVVQGWDVVKRQTKDTWHHLQYQIIGGEVTSGCSCPVATGALLCIHQRYFVDAGLAERNEANLCMGALIFFQRPLSTVSFLSLFSVESKSSSALKGRAIVSHTGSSRTGGIWKCSKDTNLDSCSHIAEALPLLPEEFGDLLEGLDLAEELTAKDLYNSSNLSERGPGSTVSYLPVHPPKWTRLSTDVTMYHVLPYTLDPATGQIRFSLQEGDSCCLCSNGRTFFDRNQLAEYRPAKLYTLTSLYEVQVQMQKCPQCPSKNARWIGPDLRHYEVFNYNNSVLVTHELLNEYTSAYTSSETPFIAWTIQLSRRYDNYNTRFMGPDLFRAVWFSFAYLQKFDEDMACTTCGPAPETVIWDGITLSFGKEHLTSSLRPPTFKHPESQERKTIKYRPKQQLLPDRSLRKAVRDALSGPSVAGLKATARDEGFAQPVSASPSPSKALFRQAGLVGKHLKLLPSVASALKERCPELAFLFKHFLGEEAYIERTCPKVWKNFFLQIAAEELVLQLVNYASWMDVVAFLKDPCRERIDLLIGVPAMYKVFESKETDHTLQPLLVVVLRWVKKETRLLLKSMISEGPLELAREGSIPYDIDDWRKTGCFYSLRAICHRPTYPFLENSSYLKQEEKLQEAAGKRGDRCGKYYSQYGERRLTGGIMVCWCTHSICYGFHCIPFSEGRDDVFSAMVTRWPVAPKRVIYDFACALGPYCMLREPQFFGNTHFAIDHFHATGHSKCSPAAFLSEYSNINPRLSSINSSAAECGNGALRRIRKSVSYMGQERAIIYTKVFLSVWNRLKLRRMDAVISAQTYGM
ncbi:hypothetical protein DFP72DRAFT_798093 [Ephemerocybe angulata]|uniref:HMG domain-containing protein n=1 Tax=Ephemerocybe angulata TaxID=980116 RepID=A0A8H6MGJ3_9AGAR|nr:hypothetical protein DFP72DRAFT_798093 [Tulosesus angulatus]